MKRRTTPPQPYLPPQRRTRHRLSHRPHRQCRCGVIPLQQRALHPTDHVQQETHPTDNPPQSARKNGAGEARRRGGRRRGRPPSALSPALLLRVREERSAAGDHTGVSSYKKNINKGCNTRHTLSFNTRNCNIHKGCVSIPETATKTLSMQ